MSNRSKPLSSIFSIAFLILPALMFSIFIFVTEIYVLRNQKAIILAEFHSRSKRFVAGLSGSDKDELHNLTSMVFTSLRDFAKTDLPSSHIPDAEVRRIRDSKSFKVLSNLLEATLSENAVVSHASLVFKRSDGKYISLVDSITHPEKLDSGIKPGNILPVTLQAMPVQEISYFTESTVVNYFYPVTTNKSVYHLRLQHDLRDFQGESVVRKWIFWTLTLVLYGIFIINFFRLRKKIIKGLSQIQEGIDFALAGEYNHTVTTEGTSEVVNLADKLNALTAEFRARTALLENHFQLAGRFIPEGLSDLLDVKSGLSVTPGTYKVSKGYVVVALVTSPDNLQDNMFVKMAQKCRRLLADTAHMYQGHLLESRLPAFVLFFPEKIDSVLHFGRTLSAKLQEPAKASDIIEETFFDLHISLGICGGELLVTALRDNFDNLEITYFGSTVQRALQISTYAKKAGEFMCLDAFSIPDQDKASVSVLKKPSTLSHVKRGKNKIEIIRVRF